MTTQPLPLVPVATVMSRARARWAPPPKLTVSEFADAELSVATGPLAGTAWDSSFAPYQVGMMNAFHEPGVEYVVVMTSSQVGKTSVVIAVAGYHIKHDPCPILIVQPTVDPMARDFAKHKLDPVVAASPALRDCVSPKKAKDASNSTLSKSFRGGSLSIGGANSAASLASRTVRLLALDEVDRYPPELPGEGSTLSIVLKRTQAYRGRRRVLMTSTPTLKDAPIDVWFHRGDQRRFYVPCPACGHEHTLLWRNVVWKDKDPATARLRCPGCDYRIDDAERIAMLAWGEWRAEAEASEPNIVSFAIWEAYSPFSSLKEIVAGFLRAKEDEATGDKSTLHTWQNTTLGEPLEPEKGEGVEPHVVLQRLEAYEAQVPDGACCLTLGVDTQDDRLEALVIGWGPGEESWLVDRQRLVGDTSQPGVWSRLDDLVKRTYEHARGKRLPILSTCIDSAGHRTDQVYQWVFRQQRVSRHQVYATIGRAGDRPITSQPSRRYTGKGKSRPVDLYTIGVDAAKQLVTSRLAHPDQGPGFIHIPAADWADDDLAAQLTAERLVTRYSKGVPVQEWRLVRPGQRNEALDCFVLGLAALRLARVDLKLLAMRLDDPVKPAPERPPTPKRRSRWIDRERADGWMKKRR